jgi:hypothetical protein
MLAVGKLLEPMTCCNPVKELPRNRSPGSGFCLLGAQSIEDVAHVAGNKAHILNSPCVCVGALHQAVQQVQEGVEQLPVQPPQLPLEICWQQMKALNPQNIPDCRVAISEGGGMMQNLSDADQQLARHCSPLCPA